MWYIIVSTYRVLDDCAAILIDIHTVFVSDVTHPDEALEYRGSSQGEG